MGAKMENMMMSSCKNPKLLPSQAEYVSLHATKHTGFHHVWQIMYLISKMAQIWKDILMGVDLPLESKEHLTYSTRQRF